MKRTIILVLAVVFVGAASFLGGIYVERNKEGEMIVSEVDSESCIPDSTEAGCIYVPKLKLPEYKYGLNLSEFVVLDKKVEKNEVLADILLKHNVAYQAIQYFSKKGKNKEDFNPSKIRAGNNYKVLGEETKEGFKAKKIVYEANHLEYIIFNLEDSFYVTQGQNEVEKVRKEIAGIIKGSLYETFDNLEIPAAFAPKMAEIFSSTIDFYKIKEGDKFKIIFEQDYVENKPVGSGEILAVLFENNGKEFYAFYFEKDKMHEGEYFDEAGNSMRKQFLKAPVKFARISSRYSMNRFHPVAQVWRAHLGTDYAAGYGTPIISTADGVVEEARFGVYNGNYVKIRHNGQYKTQYLHMCKIGRGVRPGKRVRQGEVIGYVGSTGLATGPHVCYRFWKDGKQVDPLKQKLRFSEPLPAKLKKQFLAKTGELKTKLSEMQYQSGKTGSETVKQIES